MVQTMIKIEHFFVSIDWCQQIFFVTSCAVSAYFTSRQSSVSINDHLSLTFRLLTWLVLIVEFFRTGDLPNLNRFNLDGSVVIVMKMVKGVMKFMILNKSIGIFPASLKLNLVSPLTLPYVT